MDEVDSKEVASAMASADLMSRNLLNYDDARNSKRINAQEHKAVNG
jgi:hypothetical protein